MDQVIGIYHKDCTDGTTAAAVLLRKFPNAEVHPLQHGQGAQEIENIVKSARPGASIYTVDCGLGAREFLEAGYRVTTVDHHRGVKQELEELARNYPAFTFIFDNDKSGASLSWSYFFPGEEEPEVIKFVEDFDLWKWAYGSQTKNIIYYLSMFLNQPEKIRPLLDEFPDAIKEKGAALSQYADSLIERYVSTIKPRIARIGPHEVPAFNIVDFQSECGNILSERHDRAVMLYTINGNSARLSFRSKDHQHPSSSELAERLGGGGHRNSAGAHIPLAELIRILGFPSGGA